MTTFASIPAPPAAEMFARGAALLMGAITRAAAVCADAAAATWFDGVPRVWAFVRHAVLTAWDATGRAFLYSLFLYGPRLGGWTPFLGGLPPPDACAAITQVPAHEWMMPSGGGAPTRACVNMLARNFDTFMWSVLALGGCWLLWSVTSVVHWRLGVVHPLMQEVRRMLASASKRGDFRGGRDGDGGGGGAHGVGRRVRLVVQQYTTTPEGRHVVPATPMLVTPRDDVGTSAPTGVAADTHTHRMTTRYALAQRTPTPKRPRTRAHSASGGAHK